MKRFLLWTLLGCLVCSLASGCALDSIASRMKPGGLPPQYEPPVLDQ